MTKLSIFIIESTNHILFTYPTDITATMNTNDHIVFDNKEYIITKKVLNIKPETLNFFLKEI